MPPKTMKPMAASFATRKIPCIRVDSRTLWTLTTNAVTEVEKECCLTLCKFKQAERPFIR